MSFVRKSLAVGFGQVVTLGFSVITGAVFSRILGVDGMGQYELFRNTSILACTIAVLGLGQAGIYFLNSRSVPYERVVTNAMKSGLVIGLACGATLALIVRGMPDYFGPLAWAPILAFAVGTGAMSVRNMLRPVLVARLHAKAMVVVDVSPFAALFLIGLIAAWMHQLSVANAIILYSLSNVISTGILVWYVRAGMQWRQPFDWTLFRSLAWYGLKLGAANLLLVLSGSLTVLVLRLVAGSESFADIGLYTRAVAVTGLVMLLPRAISPMLYAKWSGAPTEELARQVELVARIHVVYGLLAAAFLLVGGRWVLWLLYGPAFLAAEQTLTLLGFATAMFAVLDPFLNLLAAKGEAGVMLALMAISVVVLSVLLFPLVSRMASNGAAIATLLSNGVTLIVGLIICHIRYGVRITHCLVLTPDDLRVLIHSGMPRKVATP